MKRLRDNFLPYCGYSLALNVQFALVYGVTNYLAAQRDHTWRLYFDSELAIPFVPGFIAVYGSLGLLLVLPLIALERRELKPFALAFALVTVIAGFVFLLLPAQLGFARTALAPGYEAIYAALYQLDLPHNMAPSLHVAYSVLTVAAAVRGKAGWVGALLGVWLAAICASVLLTHQHHVIDVISGLVLGVLGYRVYLRWRLTSIS